MRNLKTRSHAPWLCAGDFNEVTKQSEKLGGRTRPHSQMQAFRDVLDECGFMDLGFVGSKFTWHKHYENFTVWERLDRAVANNEWFSLFPDTQVHHLDVTTSDHKPLLINPDGMDCKQQRPFRFEQMWMSDPGCGATIEAVWQQGGDGHRGERVIKKVDKCGKSLTKWSKTCFRNVRRELEQKRKKLAQAERVACSGGSVLLMKKLEKEINVLLDKEAQMWGQRAKVQWLKDGDRNTRFFHSKASQRRRKNYIKGLYDNEGQWCTNPSRMEEIVLEFYQALFTSQNPENFDEILAQIPRVVTDDMNNDLMAEFQKEEVETALKQMAPLKSPGPDGMPPIFYQHYWSLVGNDVVDDILYLLNSGNLPPSLCHSFITLIPKVHSPEYISQYRPISLSNVLYRIFSKVLANRLKKILPNLVSE